MLTVRFFVNTSAKVYKRDSTYNFKRKYIPLHPFNIELLFMVQQATGNEMATCYKILFTLGLCHFLNDMIQSVIPATYPMLKDGMGFTFVQIGIITLVMQLASSIFQPFIGFYTDRHPLPFSLSWGMCSTFVGLVLIASASDFTMILVSVVFIGCGSSVFHPESSRIAQVASGGRKGLAQSIFQVGGNGGSAIGPLIAALIILPFGRHAIGWFAIVALLTVAILWKVGKWYGNHLYLIKQRCLQTPHTGLSKSRINGAMAILVLMLFSKYFFNACMTNYYTFYLIERFGVTVQQSQLCLFLYLGAFALGTLIGGAVGDRYGRKYVILFSIIGAAPFTMAMPFLGLWGVISAATLSGLIIASAFSAIIVYATDLKPAHLGVISGVFFGLMFGLGGIGAAFFGWLADQTSIEYVFRLSTLLPLLGIVAIFLPNVKVNR